MSCIFDSGKVNENLTILLTEINAFFASIPGGGGIPPPPSLKLF